MIDANNLPDGQRLTTGLCIVGAGAAGIGLALEMIGSGIEVLMIEAGGSDRPTPPAEAPMTDAAGDTESAPTGWHAFGGHCGRRPARCRAFPEQELAVRPFLPDSGWPLSAEDLAPAYDRARTLCEPVPPLPVASPAATPLIEGVCADDFDCRDPDRYADALDFGSRYGRQLAAAGNITVMAHATVTRLRLNAGGTAITALEVRTGSGRRIHVQARTVVLAAGALETARLLLASRDVQASGIGNARGNVGRYVLAALRGTIGTVNLTRPLQIPWHGPPNRRISRRPLALTASAQQRHQLPAFALRLRPLNADDVLTRALSRFRPGALAHAPLRIDWQCEQAPTAAGRVVVIAGDADRDGPLPVQVEWQPGAADFNAVRRALDLFDETLRHSGAGRFDHDPGALAATLMPAAPPIEHLLGGARMGHDPRHSVTDPQGRVHGVDNLYVTGMAVFPTSGLDNPLLTVVALGLRLADHLKSRELRPSAAVVSLHRHVAARRGGAAAAADPLSESRSWPESPAPGAGDAD